MSCGRNVDNSENMEEYMCVEYHENLERYVDSIYTYRAEALALIHKDFEVLVEVFETNLQALANPIYRRFGVNLWYELDIIQGRIADPLQSNLIIGVHHETSVQMLSSARGWFRATYSSMNSRTGGVLHMINSGPSIASNIRHGTSSTSPPPTTRIITQGEIALIRIPHAWNNVETDLNILLPFYEQIQDYEHLIIDIRGHRGGFTNHFLEVVMEPLIQEPMQIPQYLFFTAGGYFSGILERNTLGLRRITENDYNPYGLIRERGTVNCGSRRNRHEISVYCARTFVLEQGLQYFNMDDLEHLAYMAKRTDFLIPSHNGFPFNGKVWLLVDRATASAGDAAALAIMTSEFATVVGSPTAGITPSTLSVYHFFLPNTRTQLRLDVVYVTDMYGRSIVEFGVIPHYLNRPGMDALQTVLAMIEEMEEGS